MKIDGGRGDKTLVSTGDGSSSDKGELAPPALASASGWIRHALVISRSPQGMSQERTQTRLTITH